MENSVTLTDEVLSQWVARLAGFDSVADLYSIPASVERAIQTKRSIYQDFRPYSFDDPVSTQAYWIFWWPRQIALLKSFFELAKLKVSGGVWDFGCGGVPGAILFPKVPWWAWDRSLTLVNQLNLAVGVDEFARRPVSIVSEPPLGSVILFQMSFGEILPPLSQLQGWLKAGHIIVIIEPGTSEHFSRLKALRDQLVAKQLGRITFPCDPQLKVCPMGLTDWCHGRRPWKSPDWYTRLAQRLEIDVRFLKYSGLVIHPWVETVPDTSENRVVSVPERVGAKSAKIWSWQACGSTGIQVARQKFPAKDPPWPWDPSS